MKFRIMENENGKYVQKKYLGIWCNWFIFSNSCTPFKQYYDMNVVELEREIIRNNTKSVIIPTKILKEFTV